MPTVTDEGTGNGTADKITTTYDTGRVKTVESGGFTTSYLNYDDATGVARETNQQVGNGQKPIKITSESDAFGRPLNIQDGNSNAASTKYNTDVITYTDGLTSSEVVTTPPAGTGPTQVVRTDSRATYSTVTSYTVANATAGKTGTLLLSLQVAVLDLAGRTTSVIRYADVGTTSESDLIADLNKNMPLSAGASSYTTTYGYDAMGRQNMVKDAVGTITRTVYDGLGRVASTWIGTNDYGATDTTPHGTASTNNMTKVSEIQYDKNLVGDGNVSQVTQYVSDPNATGHDASTDRVTKMYYDWQDRQVASDNTISTTSNTLNNLGEMTDQKIYDDSVGTITVTNGVLTLPASIALRGEKEAQYDARGRVYQSQTDNIVQQTYVDPSGHSISAGKNIGHLTTTLTYDARDHVVNEVDPGGLVTQSQFDGAGRMVKQTTGSAKVVLNSQSMQYDPNGNSILLTKTNYGPAGARTSYVANYYDAANRQTDTVNLGTNGGQLDGSLVGGVNLDDGHGNAQRPATIPARSNTILVASNVYNSAGYLWKTIGPDLRGIETIYTQDALGRVKTELDGDLSGPGSVTPSAAQRPIHAIRIRWP